MICGLEGHLPPLGPGVSVFVHLRTQSAPSEALPENTDGGQRVEEGFQEHSTLCPGPS